MTMLAGLFTLGKDAELRYTSAGDAVCGLSLAYNYGRPDQDGKKPTQWIRADLWGKRAESLAQYLPKGKQIYAQISDVHIEEYTGNDGQTRTSLRGRIDDLEFTRGNKEQSNAQPTQNEYGATKGKKPRQQVEREPGSDDDLDDDPPF